MNILLGVTGSVASVLAKKIVKDLRFFGEVRVIMTDAAEAFTNKEELLTAGASNVYNDRDEWSWEHTYSPGNIKVKILTWQKDDEILHIKLRDWADILVVAPATANSIAKFANGFADNLLSSIWLAWDISKTRFLAPAMNTHMWSAAPTKKNMMKISGGDPSVKIIMPVTKQLACGDTGVGALAEISDISASIKASLRWSFPLSAKCPGIPIGNHPGAFGAKRKFDRHCGVDLYCNDGAVVTAVENGRIVLIEPFTGPSAGFPWWLDTKCVKIESSSGVIGYGEIVPDCCLEVGDFVWKNQIIGHVTPVLPPEKARHDIPGHSVAMLHMQLYKRGMYHKDKNWELDSDVPDGVLDPTYHLIGSENAPNFVLEENAIKEVTKA